MNMRKSKRAYGAFPVRMRGFDESGCAFKATSLADNISAGGMYLQLGRRMADGSRLFAVVRLQTGANILGDLLGEAFEAVVEVEV